MEEDEHHKTDEIGKNAPADAGRTAADDLTEIDPSEFFDPEEIGVERQSSRSVPEPWGCLWCKKPLPTRQAMVEHHARHCSEEIEHGNEAWNKRLHA
jgi:hypothetical protein